MPNGRMYRRAPMARSNRASSRSFTSASKARRSSQVAKKRATNQPIARIQRRRRAPITKVAKNTRSVLVLAKQVRALQRSQIGLIQRHVLELNQIFIIPKVTPAIFSLINFSPTVQVTEQRHLAVAPYVQNTLLATFQPADEQLANTPEQTAKAAVLDSYKFYKTSTDDSIPADASYVPISTSMLVQLETTFETQQEMERWVLIMIVKQKPRSIHVTSNVHHYNLPDASAGLMNLADKNPFDRMPFPTRHYQVLVKKWVKLVHSPVDNTHVATKTFTLKFNYPHQYVNNDISNVTDPLNPTGPVISDNFNQRIPIAQNVFCLMQASSANVYVRIRKTDVWRDPHGNQ